MTQSLQHTLLKAQHCAQRGQLDTAIKLCRGLLRLLPQNEQVNGLLGSLYLQINQPEPAVKLLEVAFSASPHNPDHWLKLLVAHRHAGQVQRARELLQHGLALGVPDDRIEQLRKELREPPASALDALRKLMASGNHVSAEIAARMMLADYPESQAVQDRLNKVLAMGKA